MAGQHRNRPAAEPAPEGASGRGRTRRRLSEAALREFAERGYQPVTVEDIVRRAGTSRATFYLHFSKKSDVLLEIYSTQQEAEQLALFARFDALGSYPNRPALRAWIEEAVAFWEARQVFAELAEQVVAQEPEIAAEWMARTRAVVDTLHNYLDRFSPTALPRARMQMGMLIMALERSCYFWNRGLMPGTRAELVEVLTDTWWTLFRHPSTTQRMDYHRVRTPLPRTP